MERNGDHSRFRHGAGKEYEAFDAGSRELTEDRGKFRMLLRAGAHGKKQSLPIVLLFERYARRRHPREPVWFPRRAAALNSFTIMQYHGKACDTLEVRKNEDNNGAWKRGRATSQLIADIFALWNFNNEVLQNGRFRRGSGKRENCGNDRQLCCEPHFSREGISASFPYAERVNDLLMSGAQPKYLTCGFIIEEERRAGA